MNKTPQPGFFALRGFMKSGTNWLGGLLDRHPEVVCRGEYHWHEILGPVLTGKSNMTFLRYDEEYRKELTRQLRGTVRRMMLRGIGPEIKMVGDRTPTTIEPLILRVPQIVIVRDGRDILVSRAFHLFNRPDVSGLFQRSAAMAETLEKFKANKWHFREHPSELLAERELVAQTARWWVEQLKADARAAKANARVPMRFIRYEDLLLKTKEISDELFEFLGVDPKLAPPIEKSLAPGFEEEKPDQFFRKGAAGDWQNYFTDDAKRTFKRIANDELIRQGYVEDANW